MKVMLVNPSYTSHIYSGWRKAVSIYLPLGLAYIAAVLEKNGIEVQVLDANAEGLSMQDTVEKVVNSSAEIVGFPATTTMIPPIYQLSKEIKERTNKIVVVGGPHVTFMPEQTLKECRYIDIVVRGEGEYTMLELVKNLEDLAHIKGITYRDADNTIITNPDRGIIKNIEEIPYPARYLFPMDLYKSGPLFESGIYGKEFSTIITSRGCPNKCTYCSSSRFWNRVRLRSPENVVAEIEHLVNKYGTRQIHFLDDAFTIPKSRIEKVCDLIIEKELSIKWTCYSRVNSVTETIVKKMKLAGCFGLNFGIESGNQEILNRAKKDITLDQSRKAVKYTKKYGLIAATSFMIGLPGDNYDTVNQTINFAIELNPDVALFCMTTPFPGTELYDEALEKGWIKKDHDWDIMKLHGSTKFRNDELSSEDIEKLYKKANRKFHFRLPYVLQASKRIIRDPRELKKYIRGVLYLVSE